MTRADFKHRPSHRDRRSPLGAVLLVASALFGAPAASADVVQEPPEQCPAGSTGDTSHCGPRCAPRICTDVAQCAAGELCQPRALCLTQMECWPHYPEDAGPSYQDKVEGPCPAQAPCAVGTCQTLKVCAPPPPPPDAGAGGGAGAGAGGSAAGGAGPSPSHPPVVVEQGCGCRAAGRGPRGTAAWLLAMAAVALGLRRGRATTVAR